MSENETQSLAPGDYGEIRLDDNATLIFSGGDYNVRLIDAKEGSKLLFQKFSQVRVEEDLTVEKDSVLGPEDGSGITAGDIGIFVSGDLAVIEENSTVDALLYVQGGAIDLGANLVATGAFVADVIEVDEFSQLTLDSFFKNHPPTLDSIADPTAILEDAGQQTINLSGISQGGENETSPSPQFPLTVTATSSNTALIPNPTVSYTSPDTTGSLSYTPVADQNGSVVITVTVIDAGGTANGGIDTFERTFTVDVTAVNDAPSFAAGPNQTVLEDAGPQSTAWTTSVSAGPPNESGQTLTFNVVGNSNPGLFAAGPAIDSSGTLTYTTALNANGSANIDVTVMDNGGTANGGVDTSGSQSFTIDVIAVNDPPNALNDSATTAEDTSVSVNVVANDDDLIDGGSVVASSVTVQTGPSQGSTSVDGTGTVEYTPNADFNGNDSFVYQVCDNGIPGSACATATVSITITPVQDAPRPVDDTASVDESGTVTLFDSGAASVLANDLEVDGESLDAFLVNAPDHGDATVNSNGTFSYEHDGSLADTDRFTYEACDATECTTASVLISVNQVNDPPLGDPQTVLTDGGDGVEITLTGVDPEGGDVVFDIQPGQEPTKGTLSPVTSIIPDPIGRCSLTAATCLDIGPSPIDCPDVETLPQACVASPPAPITSATVTYLPDTADDLEDSFTFTVTEVDPDFLVGLAVVDINPVDFPVPVPPSVLVVEACPADLVLITDPEDPNFGDLVPGSPGCFEETLVDTPVDITLNAGAPEGDTLAFVVLSLPADGSLADSEGVDIGVVPTTITNPQVTYTPDSLPTSFTGQDSFNFEVTGTPSATSDIGTVFIDVVPLFELAEDQTVETTINTPVEVTLDANPGGSGSPASAAAPPSLKFATRAPEIGLDPLFDANPDRDFKFGTTSVPLPGATIAGQVTDIDFDEFGEATDVSEFIAAGIDTVGSPLTLLAGATGENIFVVNESQSSSIPVGGETSWPVSAPPGRQTLTRSAKGRCLCSLTLTNRVFLSMSSVRTVEMPIWWFLLVTEVPSRWFWCP